jgi:hypothetical protein
VKFLNIKGGCMDKDIIIKLWIDKQELRNKLLQHSEPKDNGFGYWILMFLGIALFLFGFLMGRFS